MSDLPRTRLLLSVALLLVVSLACSSISAGQAAQAIRPKPGHWEGNPSVSLDVTADGQVRNYKIIIPFGMPGQTCTLKEDKVVMGPHGEITIGEPTERIITGTFKSIVSVTGTFTSNMSIGGNYKIAICKSTGDRYTVVTPPREGTWSAEWKQP